MDCSYIYTKIQDKVEINYTLISISLVAPIVRLGLTTNMARKIPPKRFVFEWLVSAIFGCLLQFFSKEITLLNDYIYIATFITSAFAKEIFAFLKDGIKPTLASLLAKFVNNNTKKDD